MKSRTKQFQTSLRIWDAAYKAHIKDVQLRGKAMTDLKRLKLLLASKTAFLKLNTEFHKLIGQ